MIVAFYSDSKGSAGTTSNLCLVAAYLAMIQSEKILLWENHFNWNQIGATIKKPVRHEQLREEMSSYQLAPIKEIYTQLNRQGMHDINLFLQAQEIYYRKLYYLENREQNEEVFEKELVKALNSFLELLKRTEGHVFIDVADYTKESTKTIIEHADVVVCNLCQDSRSLDKLLRQSKENQPIKVALEWRRMREKVFFLIGKYDRRSKNTLKRIMSRYQIDRNHIGTIPYNTELKDAMELGKVIQFLSLNMSCDEEDDNYYFMEELCGVANMIMRGGIKAVGQE